MDNLLDLVDRLAVRFTAWALGFILEWIEKWLQWMDGYSEPEPVVLHSNIFDELETTTDGDLLFQEDTGAMLAFDRDNILQVEEDVESQQVILQTVDGGWFVLDKDWWDALFENEIWVQARPVEEEMKDER